MFAWENLVSVAQSIQTKDQADPFCHKANNWRVKTGSLIFVFLPHLPIFISIVVGVSLMRVSVFAEVVIGAGRAEPLKDLAASINFSWSTTDKLTPNYPHSVFTSDFLRVHQNLCLQNCSAVNFAQYGKCSESSRQQGFYWKELGRSNVCISILSPALARWQVVVKSSHRQ